MNALAAQPPAKMPRSERQQYKAFTSLVRVLAAGESHSIDRLIPPGHILYAESANVIRRLMLYGAATRAGDVVSGVTKRAGRLLRNEAEFCEVGAFDAVHAADMQVVLDNEPDTLLRAQALERAHEVLDVETLLARLDMSKSNLYTLLAYADLTPLARGALEDNGLSWRYAYGLRRCPPERQVDVVMYLTEHQIPVKESSRSGLLEHILESLGVPPSAEKAAVTDEGLDPNAAADDSQQPIGVVATRVGMNRRSVYDMIYRGEVQAAANAEGLTVVRVSDVARLRSAAQAATEARMQALVAPREPVAEQQQQSEVIDDTVSEKELLETCVKLNMATLRAVELLTERVEAQQRAIAFLAAELGYEK